MKYFINIPDEQEEKQVLLETFCQDNKIRLNIDNENFIGRGVTTDELILLMNDYFDSDDKDIDKDKILKFFTLKRIAKELLFQLGKIIDEQFGNNFMPVANSIIKGKLEDYTRRAINMQELIDKQKTFKMPRTEYSENFMERSDGVEPIRNAELFIKTDMTMVPVSLAVSTVSTHLLHIYNEDDFCGLKTLVGLQLQIIHRFQRRVVISLLTQSEKDRLLNSCFLPYPKEPGKDRCVPGSFKALLGYFSDLSAFINTYDKSEKQEGDLLALQNKGYSLILDYAKRFPQVAALTKAEADVKETVVKIIRTDKRLGYALDHFGYDRAELK